MLITRPFQKYQKIHLPDGRLLVGPKKQLGYGAFGHVVQYTLDSQNIAVKIPLEPEHNVLQQQEIQLLKNLKHPNVIDYLGDVEINGKQWLFMTLMHGTVRDLLTQTSTLSWPTKLAIAIQMATGLAYLHHLQTTLFHNKGIIHGDLKPENLLVDKLADDATIQVRIGDFGMAKQVNQIYLPLFGKISTKFQPGDVGGTLLYIAPEVISAAIMDEQCGELKSDVFSAGIILWELANHRQPRRSADEIKNGTLLEFHCDKINHCNITTKRSFLGKITVKSTPPTYPKSLFFGPVIDKCLQPHVKDRASACELLDSLTAITSSLRMT